MSATNGIGTAGTSSQRRERFECLYHELYRPIAGYVMRRAANREDGAEVIAETFATLWRRLDGCPSGDELRPWLFGVARLSLANQRRGDRRRSALSERLIVEPDGADTTSQGAGSDGRVARAFAALGEPDREILSLVAWEGLTHEELAVALGVSRGLVRLRLHRARRRFIAALDREAPSHAVGPASRIRLSEGEDHERA